ncbi:MAG: type II toxin-antitoxin system RelE/ParE family toxin [Leptospirales bacterium]
MSNIIFSPIAIDRLSEIAEYLYQQNQSKTFILDYLGSLETYLNSVLSQFPESGTPMEQFGKCIRRIVYQKYSFLYRTAGN